MEKPTDMYFVAVPQGLFDDFRREGYEPLVNGDKCQVMTEQYGLGHNLFFYIETQGRTKTVTDVLIGKDPTDPTKDTMTYKYSTGDLKGPVRLGSKSWCGVFQTIVAPDETENNFRMRLSLWTKGGSFWNPKKSIKLVYHCPPPKEKPPPPNASDSERLQSGGYREEAKKGITKPAAAVGSTVLVLSLLGLGLGLYWKSRQQKKLAEELLAKPN
jgi:hypothetical protein